MRGAGDVFFKDGEKLEILKLFISGKTKAQKAKALLKGLCCLLGLWIILTAHSESEQRAGFRILRYANDAATIDLGADGARPTLATYGIRLAGMPVGIDGDFRGA